LTLSKHCNTSRNPNYTALFIIPKVPLLDNAIKITNPQKISENELFSSQCSTTYLIIKDLKQTHSRCEEYSTGQDQYKAQDGHVHFFRRTVQTFA